MTNSIDMVIQESLREFSKFLTDTEWHGREREAVSLYAFGFLSRKCHPNSPLHTATQIGLDVAVCQNPGPRRKKLVCKDLVIWANAAGNCWNNNREATQSPLVVMEWKARTRKISKYDEDWLVEFSNNKPNFLGYAVSLDRQSQYTKLVGTRIKDGQLEKNWIDIEI